MEQFNLEKYLENPSREVVTRDRRKVRIICTDCKSSALPIIAEIQNPKTNTWFIDFFNIDGTTEIDKQKQRDLFFADEELTEFDYAILSIISDHNSHTDSIEAFAKRSSKKLLDLARKEIEKENPYSGNQKQELSEEDEKKINGLVKGLEDRMGFGWASQPFTREEYIEWLKCLKDRIQPQPHWKPSEFQLECLKKVIPHYNTEKDCELEDVLTELYNDLKNL